jgi:phospholipid/cholesterol/gamma-HCH transport system substrate-binding protein
LHADTWEPVLMAAPNWSRIGRVAVVAITSAAVAVAVGSWAPVARSHRAQYCAIMPDSVGLYAGNPVTQMGYEIGKVKSITPGILDVRVDFTVTANRPLPQDVTAIIRSTSVLADRSLELVGNAAAGPLLPVGGCIPLSHSFTPKSLSEMIGSATNLINSITPDGSTNVGDVIRDVDHAIHNNGAGINELLTTASSVVHSPDQTVNDIGAVVTNIAQITSLLRELREPMKQVLLDLHTSLPSVVQATGGGSAVLGGTLVLVKAVSDIEQNLGDTIQSTLDDTSVFLRKAGAHGPALADLLNPVPSWINIVANHVNNRELDFIRYRPPLYRIRTPDGVALCNMMNASMPGSCANVQGTPYAVDVALLQYALSQARR